MRIWNCHHSCCFIVFKMYCYILLCAHTWTDESVHDYSYAFVSIRCAVVQMIMTMNNTFRYHFHCEAPHFSDDWNTLLLCTDRSTILNTWLRNSPVRVWSGIHCKMHHHNVSQGPRIAFNKVRRPLRGHQNLVRASSCNQLTTECWISLLRSDMISATTIVKVQCLRLGVFAISSYTAGAANSSMNNVRCT